MAMNIPKGGGGGGARRGRRRGRRSPPMSDINVTPFVDVMLVLLIIFMVAAPLLTVGVPLELPKTSANQLPAERKPPLAVSVDAAGALFLGEEPIPFDTMVLRLGQEMAAREESPEVDRVYVRADGSVAYAQVMRVMGALNSGGFRNIGLVTARASRNASAGAPAGGAATAGGAADALSTTSEAAGPVGPAPAIEVEGAGAPVGEAGEAAQ